MKKDRSGRTSSTVIKAWAEEESKKVTIQIEDSGGKALASIQLSPDKASDLSDSLAIYAAKLKIAARGKGATKLSSLPRPTLLC
jgi:hypothetical protein